MLAGALESSLDLMVLLVLLFTKITGCYSNILLKCPSSFHHPCTENVLTLDGIACSIKEIC